MRGLQALGFSPCEVQLWSGRYFRIPGETTAFHVRQVNAAWWPVALWSRDDTTGICRMVDEGDVRALATAVNAGKAALGASPGGAFLIDVHGRVLVPAGTGSGTVMVVGEWVGPLRFHDPFAGGATFDFYDDTDLNPGAAWNRPYVGVRHNLSASGHLYFWHDDDSGARAIRPPAQDAALVAALRRIRPYGPVRFVVGPGGVVITKVPPAWGTRYVGRLDLTKWFPKEEMR